MRERERGSHVCTLHPLSLCSGFSNSSNLYFDEPQYSTPSVPEVPPTAEYEVPITSPVQDESNPHVYDYAALPRSMAPEYAELEPKTHAYHMLDIPEEPAVGTAAGRNGVAGTASSGGKRTVIAGDDGEGLGQAHEYATLEQK